MFKAYKRYVDFEGRSGRSEFWLFTLWIVIATIVAGVLDYMLFNNEVSPISWLLALGNFLPNLAVGVRRLHDTNRTGWWLLIGVVPLLGWIVLVVFLCIRGTPGANRFGSPDGVTAELEETFA